MKLDYNRHARSRLFQNDFLEAAPNIPPVPPCVLYIPVIAALMAWGLSRGLTTWTLSLICFPSGWLVWDFAEYALHRWFFHWEGNGPFTRKVHDIIHGYHHLYPATPRGWGRPPGASIPRPLRMGGPPYLWGVPTRPFP